MGMAPTDSLALLESLAPTEGWETDLALMSTYSVDLVAVAALVMALAGEGDDHERMKSAALARACEKMRGRFRVVCQAGRVAVPVRGADTLVLADQWIREVPYDGREHSWHAKLALIRYRRTDEHGIVAWRLWMGSRNITRDTSWDSALMAVGKPGENPDPVSGAIAEAGRILAENAKLPGWDGAAIAGALAGIQWQWPDEIIKVVHFGISPDSTMNAFKSKGLPDAPQDLQRLVAISPFVDPTTCAALGRWGGANSDRRLLTTPTTLAALAAHSSKPLAGFGTLYVLDAALLPEEGETDTDATGEEAMTEIHRGLHAKLIWAQAGDGDHLWLGSSNLTSRAWNGKNTEVMIHAKVNAKLAEGLVENFLGQTRQISRDALPLPPENDQDGERLEALRNRIAAEWQARLIEENDNLRCVAHLPPVHPDDGAVLHIRLLGNPNRHIWRPGTTAILFPCVPLHQKTELLVIELSFAATPDHRCAWVARAPLDPAPDADRDRSVLARLMGPRAFLTWLRSLLDEVVGDEDDADWPEPATSPPGKGLHRRGLGLSILTPTLESLLRAWSRNPDSIRKVDEAVTTWLKKLQDASVGEEEKEAMEELNKFQKIWEVLREGLGITEKKSA